MLKPEGAGFNIKGIAADMAVDLKLTIGFSALAFLSIYLPYVNETILRTALGLSMALFLPGYALVSAFFPEKTGIGRLDRIVLSSGLSIAIIPLVGLGLNFTSWGIRLDPIVTSLAVFTLVFTFVASWRRHNIPLDDRFTVDFGELYGEITREIFPPSEDRISRRLAVILVLLILISIPLLAYVIIMPRQGEPFTEFYILGPDGKAENYPTMFTLGDSKPVIVGIVNHEQRDISYDLVIQLNNSSAITQLYLQNILLANNQTWEHPIQIKPDKAGNGIRIEFLLYADGNTTAPYRNLLLNAIVV